MTSPEHHAARALMAEVGAHQVQVAATQDKAPFYPKLLRLKHIHPNAWQRAALGEGMAFVGYLLSPAGIDVAPYWAIPVLPLAVALTVKSHDLLAGILPRDTAAEPALVLSVGEEQWALTTEQVELLQRL